MKSKKKKSSRSRSRSYSPSYNRERNHPRVYQNRDFRGHNRGYRRPYYFRGRGRGFYPRGQHNRGGYGNYRPNWQNYNRQPYSPRRGRSRSRSPKRRSGSPRSRSRSRNSDKSTSDRSRSSSSRSSSNHSRVEVSKRKSKKEKKSHSKDQRGSAQPVDDDSKEQSGSGGADTGSKTEGSKAWQDVEAYDTSPVPQDSPAERAPTVKSSVQSVVVRRCSPRPSPVQKTSPPSPSVLQSSGAYRASSRQSPFDQSLSPPRKSPLAKSPPLGSLYGNQKEEGRSAEMAAPIGTGYKRFMEEQRNKAAELEKENKDKDKMSSLERMKDRTSPTDFAMNELEKAYRKSQSPKRFKMRDGFEKLKLAELRFAKEEAEQEKKGRSRKDSDSDSKNQDPYDPAKWEELSFIPSAKEKRRKSEDMDDDPYIERPKKEEKSSKRESAHKGFLPEKNFKVTGFKSVKERSESPPVIKSAEVRDKEKVSAKEELAFTKSTFCISREAGPSVRLDSFDEDLARPSGVLAQERKLSRDLVHSNKKDQEFKSIFQHIQSAQPQRSPSELFAQHIVTIVHHVKEHHFGPSSMTLSERFAKYLKRAKDQESSKSKKSPEIHRRIDISPSAFRKHGFLHEEAKHSKETGLKGDGKYRDEPSDLRQDIERRKKHKDKDSKRDHSRDSGDSRDSSRSRDRSSEKTEKSRKSSKKHKKHRKVRERSRSSSSSSHSSHSLRAPGNEEYPAESEEKEDGAGGFDKSRMANKDFQGNSERGRARGTLQFRARGTRPWGRGAFPGNNNNNNNDFQKRNRDEEWDPEYTPKSKKYYLHDDREGENEEKWMNRGRGRANFARGRGRFLFRKPGISPKWAHDKFSGEEGEIEEDESGAENKDEKGNIMSIAE
ncbi:thyroid hormone receptor associated protein 3 S homeolog isoform X2 [Xenopus laevis]|uniref:Thyroid hormone receptor associated protein 3 S homeolog isoform X2 n=1 Tax=Xenopus laevis TaxID=8355 RepID=A0A8J1MC90_XENLA|nr:thyroid hormone receptor associated protein 3 S homeolog isoform X2 [Xenopus laevis]